MAAISFQNVVKRYGTPKSSVQVIHNLSATVEHGEFVVIVGPSGCGKSTLLRMVAGLEEITDGTGRTRYCNGVPELRAVSTYVGV
jgi:sn-glycerol 3-phosphate transport system ATP-binding protein